MPIGRLTRKASRQPPASTRMPPRLGPRPAASAATALQSATPWARSRSECASSTSASDAGTTIAAPIACRMRAATRVPTDGAAAHSTDASVKMTMPHSNSRLRPSRSAIRPAATMKAANTML